MPVIVLRLASDVPRAWDTDDRTAQNPNAGSGDLKILLCDLESRRSTTAAVSHRQDIEVNRACRSADIVPHYMSRVLHNARQATASRDRVGCEKRVVLGPERAACAIHQEETLEHTGTDMSSLGPQRGSSPEYQKIDRHRIFHLAMAARFPDLEYCGCLSYEQCLGVCVCAFAPLCVSDGAILHLRAD
jgi:hypothetical protein